MDSPLIRYQTKQLIGLSKLGGNCIYFSGIEQVEYLSIKIDYLDAYLVDGKNNDT